jgi:uncharacterized repeat protein (TIGR01451 family)
MLPSLLLKRRGGFLVSGLLVLFLLGGGSAAQAGQAYLGEAEPNGTFATASPIDPTPGNNSATDSGVIGAVNADLSITKTDGTTSVPPGGGLSYTITATNGGPAAVTDATVSDTFPASLTCTWTCVGTGGGTCTAFGSGNIADTANLPVSASVIYTASCVVSASATGTLSNTASVAAPAGVTDPNPANDSATDTDAITPVPGALVSGTKTASGSFTVGSTVVYTIVLTNSGPGTQPNNTGNEFTDVLPPQLALVSASASSGFALANTGINTVGWNGSIPSGGTVTITINATILPSAVGTTVTNQGTIFYDADGIGPNDATAPTDDPGAGGAADPTAFQIVAIEIPTLSPLALLVLAAALTGVAFELMKRRRQAA